ncbi:DUF3800 domain-containing protein [Nesterenkonia sedimenti]|uniref:DUF3800 domain-containing protein n=1 Tax=Nesterenkonia sedimenti TaxID=1463632 RepID=UPI001B3B218D|nr:DUF3800 domain-containing protein [Nesterenkonia sedimenti]
MSDRTLFVFLDESGDLNFSAKGTDHFVVAAVYTMDPNLTAAPMQRLKYELMAEGSEDLEFHATNNSRSTRKRAAETISSLSSHFGAKVLYVDKHYTHPKRQSDAGMMEVFGTAVARWLVSECGPDYAFEQIVLVFDSVLTGKQRKAFLKVVKPKIKSLGVPFHVMFHPVKSDLNGQIADYLAWSTYRWLENEDPGPLEALEPIDPQLFDLFSQGNTRYY